MPNVRSAKVPPQNARCCHTYSKRLYAWDLGKPSRLGLGVSRMYADLARRFFALSKRDLRRGPLGCALPDDS